MARDPHRDPFQDSYLPPPRKIVDPPFASKSTPMSSATDTMALINVHVRNGDDTFDLSLDTSETIGRVKEIIRDKTGIHPVRQALIRRGCPPFTDDSKPIGDFCKSGETLHLSDIAMSRLNAGDNPAAQNPMVERGDAGAQAHAESDDRVSGHRWDLTVTENTTHRQGDHITEGFRGVVPRGMGHNFGRTESKGGTLWQGDSYGGRPPQAAAHQGEGNGE